MIAALLALGAKLIARPAVLAGVIGLAVFGIREFQHWRKVNYLKGEVSRVTGLYQQERTQRLEALLALEGSQKNIVALRTEIERQNFAINEIAAKAKADQNAAVLAAVRKLERARESAEALRKPDSVVPPGDAAMNSWLRERFGGAP